MNERKRERERERRGGGGGGGGRRQTEVERGCPSMVGVNTRGLTSTCDVHGSGSMTSRLCCLSTDTAKET